MPDPYLIAIKDRRAQLEAERDQEDQEDGLPAADDSAVSQQDWDSDLKIVDPIAVLRDELKKAISYEHYGRAAWLRDKIRRLESTRDQGNT